jgi:hypothetical protein
MMDWLLGAAVVAAVVVAAAAGTAAAFGLLYRDAFFQDLPL